MDASEALDAGVLGTDDKGPPSSSGPEPVLTIRELYRRLTTAVRTAFPTECWVAGEIRSIKRASSGHVYIDLVDPGGGRRGADALLQVACWQGRWPSIRRALDQAGVTLEEGMVVKMRGEISIYDARSTLTFSMTEVDVEALLGRLALERKRVLSALAAEGLLDRNKKLPVPIVPLKVGLIASPGTEGMRDFLGQLQISAFGFRVALAPSVVQGRDAPASLVAALARLAHSDCDVVVIVRGGGSRGDLSAFDDESVARAVANARSPVWVGIGHTGDRSVVDETANAAFITPTECGHALVERVSGYRRHVAQNALALAGRSRSEVDSLDMHLRASSRWLTALAQGELDRHGHALAARAGDVREGSRRGLDGAAALLAQSAARTAHASRAVPLAARLELVRRAGHLASLPHQRLDVFEREAAGRRRLLAAYDYRRQLARGYSVLRDESGRVVTSTGSVAHGGTVVNEVTDGTIRSRVLKPAGAEKPPEGDPHAVARGHQDRDDHEGQNVRRERRE